MSKYRTSVIEINRQIKEDEVSLRAQLRYFEYLLENIARETGLIDGKIERLKAEREKIVLDFMRAPKRIRELREFLRQLDAKKDKLLIAPKVEKVKELVARLRRMGVEV